MSVHEQVAGNVNDARVQIQAIEVRCRRLNANAAQLGTPLLEPCYQAIDNPDDAGAPALVALQQFLRLHAKMERARPDFQVLVLLEFWRVWTEHLANSCPDVALSNIDGTVVRPHGGGN